MYLTIILSLSTRYPFLYYSQVCSDVAIIIIALKNSSLCTHGFVLSVPTCVTFLDYNLHMVMLLYFRNPWGLYGLLPFLMKNFMAWYLSSGRKWVGKERIRRQILGRYCPCCLLLTTRSCLHYNYILLLTFSILVNLVGVVVLYLWRICYSLPGISQYDLVLYLLIPFHALNNILEAWVWKACFFE